MIPHLHSFLRLFFAATKLVMPQTGLRKIAVVLPWIGLFFSFSAYAALNIPITVNLSEAVNVTGSPRIAVDVGGITRYATYSSGTGSNTLTFTLSPQTGDVDLDGVTVSSPIQLNGGTITDNKGNNATLTFTPPSTSNVKVNYPALGLDFVYDADGRYTLNGSVYNDLTSFLSAAGGSFTRSSTATYCDSTGTIQTSAANTPRFDYDFTTLIAKGILIEETRTNSIKNSKMVGVVTGTPGTLPTNWSPGGAGLGTLTQQIVATGTEKGLSYFDIRLSGTASTASYVLYTNPTNLTAAASGQNWNGSIYTKIVSGSTSNAIPYLSLYERNSSGSSLAVSSLALPTTGTLTRTNLTRTLTNASTAYIVSAITFIITSDMPVDITLRIAAPQLEQGLFATSYIPTTTAAATRTADALSLPASAWVNATAGSIYAKTETIYSSASDAATIRDVMRINDGTANNFHRLFQYKNKYGGSSTSGGVLQADLQIIGATAGTAYKIGYSYQTNAFISALGGTLSTAGTSGTTPAGLTTLYVGGTSPLNGYIQQLKYYPLKVTNTQLQLLTQ